MLKVKSTRIQLLLFSLLLFGGAAQAQTVTLADQTGEASSITGGETDVAVFAFNLTRSAAVNLTGVTVTFSSPIAGIFSNIRLFESADATFSLVSDTNLGNMSLASGNDFDITFAGRAIGGGAGTNYFVVVNVDPNILSTATMNASCTAAQIVTTDTETGSATGPTYDNSNITELSTTFIPISAGTSPVPASSVLAAGTTTQVLTGFSVSSTGTQTITEFNFNYTPGSSIVTEYIYKNTVPGTLAGAALVSTDASPDGDFTGVSEVITSTTVYYYLVVDVASSVTTSTGGITVVSTQAGIMVDVGSVNPFSINRPFTFNTSQLSDIIFTGGAASPINYRNLQLAAINNTDLTKSQRLATFQLRDGGGSDGDNKKTSITSITMQVTNPANIREIALFDDESGSQVEIGGTEQAMPGIGTVVFTPSSPIRTSADDGTFNFMVRATFNATVTDNDNMIVTITSVTSEPGFSGFAASNAGGANSSAAANKSIIVTASKLVFVAPLPPSTGVNSPFGLTVRAVDSNPFNNRDLDATGQVDLTASGGGGTLSGGVQSLSPSLTAGQFIWTSLSIDQAGTYTLDVSDDAYFVTTDLGDASTSVTITSSASTITPSVDPVLCYGGPTAFEPLGNIVITETDQAGISGSNGLYTFSLALPSGFVFDQTITSGLLLSGGSDLSSPSVYSYPGNNIVQFSFTLNGTSNINTITVGGLRARYPHPGTVSPAATGSLSITRLGGTATITGVGSGAVLGTISASQQTAAVSFTVAAVPGNVAIDPNTTSFNASSPAVNLVGSITPGAFTGSGVTFSSPDYRFNPNTLTPSTYPVTYTYTNGATGCQSVGIKSLTVFASGINNLNPSFCSNDLPSPDFSVSQTFLDQRFGGVNVWHVDHYVYYDNAVGLFGNFVPITSPSNTKFDPTLPAYQSILQHFGGRIPIGFAVCDGGTVPCDGLSSTGVFSSYQWVTVKPAPSVSFTIPKTTFCADEQPVVLTGVPANSNNTSNDKFSAIPVGQQPSITNGGSPVVWSFTPNAVSGVILGTPVSFNITYTYTNPSTGCSNTSAPTTITVNARPSSVTAGAITSGVSQQLCQGTAVSSFTANPVVGTSYKWYTDSPPVSIAGTGNSFTPAVNTTLAATSNFYVTRTINGCESNKEPVAPTSPLQLSVTVNSSPPQPVPNFNRAYCIGQTMDPNDFQITSGTNIKWYRGGTLVFTGSSPSASDITDPLKLNVNNMVAGINSFDVTQTVLGCEGILSPTKIDITIKPLPVLTVTADADPLKICKANSVITFTAFDGATPALSPPGLASWTGVAAIVPNPLAGTAQLNPAAPSLIPGDYTLTFTYQSATTNCSNSKPINLKVLPTITPSISIGTACDKLPLIITNSSVMNPPATPSTIISTKWTFGDGSVSPRLVGAASGSHLYNGVGTFIVTYVMTTSDSCVVTSSTPPVTIRPKPIANFNWSNICRDVVSSTQFNASTLNSSPVPISTYNWNFKVNNVLNYTSAGAGANPMVNYSNDGKDIVKLIVTSTFQCKDTIQKPVFITHSFPPITENNSYYEDFNSTSGGWIDGGTNSSWQHGKPAAAIINRDSSTTGNGKAWVTNLTGSNNANEQSWVLSQCYDFSKALKPVISLDIWSDTPRQIDGAVLQYNANDDIEKNANWKVIGQINQGINWYDINGIASKPGSQSTVDVGWSGDQSQAKYKKGWVHALFKLDALIGKPNVKFRIAFASNFGRQEGFAFDNVFIGERSRSVLIENFTNSSAQANATSQNNFFNTFGGTTNEIVKVQFHTGFPGYDTLNSINKPMNNARTAFYGITNSPTMRIDGKVGSGPLAAWFGNLYDERVLTPAPLKIVINTPTKVGEVVSITASITNTTSAPLNLKNANVFIVIAEKSITTMPWLGQPDNKEFKYVAKQMLPTRSGLSIGKTLAPGETFNVPQVFWNERDLINSGTGVVIVYVQSLLSDKEVYQAKLFDNPVQPDITTGIEQVLGEHIKLYPNPADQSVTIELPQAVLEKTPLHVFDLNGHRVKSLDFEKGQHSRKIDTEDFAGGIYLIQMTTGNATIIRKKIVILHQ